MMYNSFVPFSGGSVVIVDTTVVIVDDPVVIVVISFLFEVSLGQTLLSIQSIYDATRKNTVGFLVELTLLHSKVTDATPMISSSESLFLFNKADPPYPC